jgi:translation elongation factor P/translation initiation factor 5A
VPGGVIVDTYKITATVTAVDAASRHVTLVTPDGTKTTFKAGPEVVNFPQIQVGDQVKAMVAEQLVVFVRKYGEPATDGEAALVALAPVGAKPGVLMANTVEVTAKVEAIDLEHRKATLRFPDGKSKTFTVRKDVDLTKSRIGDEVVFRTTEALAITVEKP